MNIFAERLKLLKKKKGFTYEQLAEILGVGIRTVKGYASGEIEPPLTRAAILAKHLEVSLDYLIGRTNNPEVNK